MGIPIHIHFFIIGVHDIPGCQRRYKIPHLWRFKIPHTLITAWPPTCADDSNRGNAPSSTSGASLCSLVNPSTTPASAREMFRRRWTSAFVTDSEDLCCAGVSSPGIWFHFQVDVLFFWGLKKGLGWVLVEIRRKRSEIRGSVIVKWLIYAR